MNLNRYQKRCIELLSLFLVYPIFLSLTSISLSIRLSFAPIILLYLIWICYQQKNSLLKKRKQIKPILFWKKVGFRWFVIAIATIAYVFFIDKYLLFKVLLTKPLLWLQMLLIYTFLSVIPQEFVYRVFYFQRYRFLFKNENTFFFVNALLFCIAHLMFDSLFVLGITFIGGYLFAYTYHKTKSMFWVSVEHLIYGGWLFTVGMGKMLGFPV